METSVMNIPWKLTRLLVAVFGEDRVKNRKEFTPDFSESSFMQLSLGGKLTDLSREQIVDYFLGSEQAEFIVATDQVLPLADEIGQHYPEWKAGILGAADATCNQGLAIYNLRAAPLNGDFPWAGLKKGPYDDRLFLSRPQRFGFAPVLAQAALFDKKYVVTLNDILQGWQRYALTSVYRWPYNSNHAVVYRIIALCWCWLFIGAIYRQQKDSDSKSALYNILAILKNDVLYLGPRLGQSHPNNHLLADYFIGWLLQYMFPDLIPGSMDFSGYEKKWQAELQRQFYSDGGSFEHAIHYHEHGCELAMVYRLLVGSESMPSEICERLGRILRFQARLSGPRCRPWALGDTTEDTLLPLDHTQGWSSRAILAVHNHLYPEQALFPANGHVDQKSFWLLAGQKAPKKIDERLPAIVEDYPDGGFVHWVNPGDDSELLFRTGVSPHTEFIQGHMHSDSLTLYWRVKGIDLLASSGTYSYILEPQKNGNYRDYFCGPMSHSAVTIDGNDPLGPLLDGFRRGDNGLRVSHYTYGDPSIANFCVGEIHSDNCYNGYRRGVILLPGEYNVVLDIFTDSQSAQQTITGWQFNKGLDVQCNNGTLELRSEDQAVAKISYLHGAKVQLHRGEISPVLGWQSDSYGVKTPAYQARFTYLQDTPVCAYVLSSHYDDMHITIEQSLGDRNRVVVNLVHELGKDTIDLGLTGSEQEQRLDGVALKSHSTILRQRHSAPDRLVVIDCEFIQFEGRVVQNFSPRKTLQLVKRVRDGHWEQL